MPINQIIDDETTRQARFPVARERVFAAHAAVTALPACVAEAINTFADRGAAAMQEDKWTADQVNQARKRAADLIGADAGEIALLGPTSLGINLVAHGLDWQAGDQVIYYADDYPANVYAWIELARQGVEPIGLKTEHLGAITWDAIEPLLTDRTRLVSLASCHFVSGYRIDIDGIGRRLHERGILFCLDGIQTLGAFPTRVDHVDFLAADSHKWMLGPCGAGFFYVAREHFDRLRPSLLGSWNVQSPNFIAQSQIDFYAGGRRYEPGTLNLPGIVGMNAGMELLLDVGVEAIAPRILELRAYLVEQLTRAGYRLYLADMLSDGQTDLPEHARSGIVSFTHPTRDLHELGKKLGEEGVVVTIRQDRAGTPVLRLSPHFYNTLDEMERAAALIR